MSYTDGRIDQLLNTTFNLDQDRGQTKVLPLAEAIRRYVKPGMLLNIPSTATGAINEITRQFWGKKPGFEFIMSMFTGQVVNLVKGGMVKKIISSNLSTTYPTPRPSRIVQSAHDNGEIEIENWSLNTIQLRMMAGALGVKFMPTKSILGTSMAGDNADSFKVVDDPFGSGEKLGAVKAIHPDLSIVHGLAADRQGNTILPLRYDESIWGPRASKTALVTVENVVPTRVIRKYAPLVKIPGCLVSAVCHVPFGSHPQGLLNQALSEFEAYGEDYAFLTERQIAARHDDSHQKWIDKWVLSCRTHQDYLNRLGYERLMALKGINDADAWKYQMESVRPEISLDEAYNDTEIMSIAAGRLIRDRVLAMDHKIIQIGIGAAALAGCLAYHQLRKGDVHVDVVWGSGQYGYAPFPGDPYMTSAINMRSCTMLTDITEMYGVMIGGETARCISIIGAGQIDKYGNVNSTKLAQDRFLVGSGGSADATNAREIMVVTKQARARFREKLPYISSIGTKTRCLVTNLGVFEKLGEDSEFTLTRFHPGARRATPGEHIREIKEACGWGLKVAPDIRQTEPPTPEELLTLRLMDPKRHFLG